MSGDETMNAGGYAQYVNEDLRRLILRLLSELPGYTANSSTLHSAVKGWGFVLTRAEVIRQLHWLSERALVEVEPINADVLLVRLLARGQDVAAGLVHQPGVKPARAPGV